MSRGSLNLAWARAFVEELARAGVREACVAPGSRSTPLVLALSREDGVRGSVHLDERCAAFYALGVGKATGRPAAVVTTSGTAAANLFPAVVEARRSGTPLLVLTADRPHRLRGTDANQTVDQVKLYGDHVRLFHDVAPPAADDDHRRYVRALAARAVSAARGRPGAPVHLNFPFDKPLQPRPSAGPDGGEGSTSAPGPATAADRGDGGDGPGAPPSTRAEPTRRTPSEATLARLSGLLSGTGRGLLVCGPAAEPGRLGPAALDLARAAGWPLAADPLSGARFRPGAGEAAMGAYDLHLRPEAGADDLVPDLVLRVGGAPTSAALAGYLDRHGDVPEVAVSDLPVWGDHRARADEVVRADPAAVCSALAGRLAGTGAGGASGWTGRWRARERAARRAARRELGRPPDDGACEGAVAAAVARALPGGALLFAGSSMPVRDLDAFAAPRDDDVLVVGNRGASGIDGAVSTTLGAAAATGRPAAALLGDLSLHHDMNGLRAAARDGLDVVFVVVHNDGGGIFHFLPVRGREPAFTDYFATPHGLDFAPAAEMYGLGHRRLDAAGEEGGDGTPLGEAVAGALARALEAGGPWLLEVRTDREENRRRRTAVVEAAARAAAEAEPTG